MFKQLDNFGMRCFCNYNWQWHNHNESKYIWQTCFGSTPPAWPTPKYHMFISFRKYLIEESKGNGPSELKRKRVKWVKKHTLCIFMHWSPNVIQTGRLLWIDMFFVIITDCELIITNLSIFDKWVLGQHIPPDLHQNTLCWSTL